MWFKMKYHGPFNEENNTWINCLDDTGIISLVIGFL